MKVGFGYSSEQNKCAWCGKLTSCYIEYKEKSIEVRIWAHEEHIKDLKSNAEIALAIMKKDIISQLC